MSEPVERTELIVPGPAEAFSTLLGVSLPDLDAGERLPLLWHWLYLLDRPAQADLGPDGHPVRGGVPLPPGPGWSRMFAGGEVRAVGPLRCGEPATRRTRVLASEDKRGRTGPLTFVTVGHEISQGGRVVVEDRQDIVYRPRVEREAPRLPEPEGTSQPPGPDEWSIEVTTTLLFRFSALTYNAHRIHYDRGYARDVEGHPGLLVHGPLQALAMAELARARGTATVDGLAFAYRLTAPLLDGQGLLVRAGRDDGRVQTAVRDLTGRQTARGTLSSG